MLQSIREDVTRTVARIDFQFQEPEPMPLPDLPDFLTTHIDPFTGEDNSADIDGGALGVIADTLPPMAAPRPDLPEGRSEEHTSELQSLMRISYAVFCLKKKNTKLSHTHTILTYKQQQQHIA